MVSLDRFRLDEIGDCTVNTTLLWEAECLLETLSDPFASGITDRAKILEGVITARKLVEAFGRILDESLVKIRVPILFAQVKLTKAVSLDSDALDEIRAALSDASDLVKLKVAFEFTECLLGIELERGRFPLKIPGQRLKLL